MMGEYSDQRIQKFIPVKLNKDEYQELLEGFSNRNRADLFRRAYFKSKTNEIFKLKTNICSTEIKEILDIYLELKRTELNKETIIRLIAYHIWVHREGYNRLGNQEDDYNKATYLVNNISFLDPENPIFMGHMKSGPELDVIIDKVNNIYDSAYFRKLNNSFMSDFDAFCESEREFCEEKKICFLLKDHNDYHSAKRAFEYQEIAGIAFSYYQFRQQNSIPGDSSGDWAYAEGRYSEWRKTREVARICYNISNNKNEGPDYYWARACMIVEKHGTELNKFLFDEDILLIIKEFVNNKIGGDDERG